MKRIVAGLLLRVIIAALLLVVPVATIAATDADVTVTYTVEYINITDNATTIDFVNINGGNNLQLSSSVNSSLSLVAITNNSTVQTDLYLGVTAATWTGGTAHTHSDTATPDADTVGWYTHNGTGAWGDAGDIIVKYGTGDYTGWNFIYENCPAGVGTTYGLSIRTPTSTTDSVQKSNTVRVTAVSG